MSTPSAAYLYDAVRTPFGKIGGKLSGVRPDDLGAVVIRSLLSRGLPADAVDEVTFGNANGAGEENRNVGRMSALLAGLPTRVPGNTVNRLCGSGLDAAMMASRSIETGDAEVIVAGGVESMSRAPWVLPKPSRPFPTGDLTAVSTTLGWRLINPRMPTEWTVTLGEANEQLQHKFGISRERQDAFALASHQRAAQAWEQDHYAELISDAALLTEYGAAIDRDETIRPNSSAEALAALKPAFGSNGTITAGNASSLNDGAAAVLIGSQHAADRLGRAPLARIAGRGATALDPQLFGYAPVESANRALARAGIDWSEVGAVELNEAFAVQSLACIDAWGVDPDLVNQWGGAIAIGHPLGASGGRILGTLAAILKSTDRRWGVAAICIGVGQGLAMVLENQESVR